MTTTRSRAQPEEAMQRPEHEGHIRQRGVHGLVAWHTPNGLLLGGKLNRKGIAIQGATLKGIGIKAGVSEVIAVYTGGVLEGWDLLRGRAAALDIGYSP